MARQKSDEKRSAILAAAAKVYAQRGLDDAPTSAISRLAEVAEGTLFTYFKTKDDLLNALYRELKLELAEVMMSNFSRKKSVRSRMQHAWDGFINWGLANPLQRRALAQIEVSDRLTPESRQAGAVPFAGIEITAQDAFAQNLFADISLEFIAASMRALADATMNYIAQHPKQADHYRKAGFDLLWNGITRK